MANCETDGHIFNGLDSCVFCGERKPLTRQGTAVLAHAQQDAPAQGQIALSEFARQEWRVRIEEWIQRHFKQSTRVNWEQFSELLAVLHIAQRPAPEEETRVTLNSDGTKERPAPAVPPSGVHNKALEGEQLSPPAPVGDVAERKGKYAFSPPSGSHDWWQINDMERMYAVVSIQASALHAEEIARFAWDRLDAKAPAPVDDVVKRNFPAENYYVQRTGHSRCVRCDFETSDAMSFEQQDIAMHQHLDEVHPGWLLDGTGKDRCPFKATPLPTNDVRIPADLKQDWMLINNELTECKQDDKRTEDRRVLGQMRYYILRIASLSAALAEAREGMYSEAQIEAAIRADWTNLKVWSVDSFIAAILARLKGEKEAAQ